jgi:hypothetical protein
MSSLLGSEVITYNTDDMKDLAEMVAAAHEVPTPKKKKAAATAISEEVSKTAKPTGKPQYMVSVDGRNSPTVVHSTIEAARKEAERLHSTGSANGKIVRVLLVVGTYKPTYTWEDWL